MSDARRTWDRYSPPRRWPTREDVERIATEVAEAAGLSLGEVLGVSSRKRAGDARWTAMSRILAETGCSINGLGEVWGCGRRSIQRFRERRLAALPINRRLDEAA